MSTMTYLQFAGTLLATVATAFGLVAAQARSHRRMLDVRFDALEQGFGARFAAAEQQRDAVEQRLGDRIDSVEQRLGDRIDSVEQQLGDRIDSVEQRLDSVEQRLDTKIDTRFDAVTAQLAAQTRVFEISLGAVDHRLGQLEDDMLLVKQHLLGRPDAA